MGNRRLTYPQSTRRQSQKPSGISDLYVPMQFVGGYQDPPTQTRSPNRIEGGSLGGGLSYLTSFYPAGVNVLDKGMEG